MSSENIKVGDYVRIWTVAKLIDFDPTYTAPYVFAVCSSAIANSGVCYSAEEDLQNVSTLNENCVSSDECKVVRLWEKHYNEEIEKIRKNEERIADAMLGVEEVDNAGA